MQLFVEVFHFLVVVIVGAYGWMMVILKGVAFRQTVINLMDTGQYPVTEFTVSL